jgi:hypothetical protein
VIEEKVETSRVNIDELMEHPESMRHWFLEPEGIMFFEWLLTLRKTFDKELRTASTEIVIYRAQGALDILDRMLSLPNKVIKREQEKVMKNGTSVVQKTR